MGLGCRATSVAVAPDGITSATSSAFPTTFVANASFAQSSFGGGQVISFSLPCGMGRNTFLSPLDTTLSFSVSYTPSVASNVTAGYLQLVGSGASFFESLTLYSNNVPIEQINGYGALQNFLLQNTTNIADRTGGISICMGTDAATGLNGHEYQIRNCSYFGRDLQLLYSSLLYHRLQ